MSKFVSPKSKTEFVMSNQMFNILSNFRKSNLKPILFLGNVIITVDMVIYNLIVVDCMTILNIQHNLKLTM